MYIRCDKIDPLLSDLTFWKERRSEADSNRGPSAYQPNVLPLGQTGFLRGRGRMGGGSGWGGGGLSSASFRVLGRSLCWASTVILANSKHLFTTTFGGRCRKAALECGILLVNPSTGLHPSRKLPESDARSVGYWLTLLANSKYWFTTSFHGGRCRKAMLGVSLCMGARRFFYSCC